MSRLYVYYYYYYMYQINTTQIIKTKQYEEDLPYNRISFNQNKSVSISREGPAAFVNRYESNSLSRSSTGSAGLL